MTSLTTDLAKLTNIPKLTLDKLVNKSNLIIADKVLETVLTKESNTVVDIGIGHLYIKIDTDAIKYKFIPTKDLDTYICETITSKSSPLVLKLESSLRDRISSTYKELL